MNEEERQKLVEYRKRRMQEKELENDLERDLKPKIAKKIRTENENKFLKGIIIFLGTLIPLYLFIFALFAMVVVFFIPLLAMIGLNPMWLPPFLHAGIWIASIVSVYQEKSVLDTLLDRYG